MTLRQPTFGHGGNARTDEEVTVMVSKALASLDAWLALAERVLEEQREHGLSPSDLPSNGERVERVVRVDVVLDGLEELLGHLCRRPGRWILIAEDGRIPHHYWQVLCFEDGSLVAEVVSNDHLVDEERWTVEQGNRLASLGWVRPESPGPRNWLRVEATTSPDIAHVSRQAALTMTDVFGLEGNDWLSVTLSSSPRRGRTPASEG